MLTVSKIIEQSINKTIGSYWGRSRPYNAVYLKLQLTKYDPVIGEEKLKPMLTPLCK